MSNTVLRALPLLSAAGLDCFVVAVAIGFEEPNGALLLLSIPLLLCTPVGVLAHVCLTRELDKKQRRVWLRALTGRRWLWTFPEYLSSPDRATAAKTLPSGPR